MKQIIYLFAILVLSACNINNKQTNDDTSYTDDSEIVVTLGDWEEGYYKDEFGDNTDVKLVYQKVKGTHQYEDTEKMDITADIIVDKEEVMFRLLSANIYVSDEDDIVFKIKDKEGDVYEFIMKANKNGYLRTTTEEDDIILKNLLFKGGWLKVIAEANKRWGKETYHFTFNADCLENAFDD